MSGFGMKGSAARIAAAAAVIGALLSLVGAAPALAAPAPAERAQQLQSLLDCKKIADSNERLACYDKAATAFDEAEAKGDVVVVNREQAQKVRKQAFGFSMPSISLFERGQKAEDISNTESTIAEARKLPTGRWQITLADNGGVWVQIDSTEIPIDPKVGQHVKISKAALGSYAMSVGNQREVKVRRVE